MECTKWRRSLQEVCLQENPTEEIIVGKEYMKKKWYVIIRDNITNIINSSLIFVGESINSF
jgi:hypothetical protein